ncbi:hypothetical protein DTO282E5_3091 [Paecilomyces variotii]|nr:hypothetical protein DTO282E5_3091 [Paecilomyces variotii]
MGGSSNQSNRTSPGSYTTAQRTASLSSGSSPPSQSVPFSQASSTAHNAMSTSDVYNPTVSQAQTSLGYPFPIGAASSLDSVSTAMRLADSDRTAQGMNGFGRMGHSGAILMRKLPRNTSREALRSMLLFAKDFIDADFVASDLHEDNGFLSAIARFNTLGAAEEARALLDGKPNSKNEANMIVEMYPGPSTIALTGRRNTVDHTPARGMSGGMPSGGPPGRQSSRFNGTFQSLERLNTTNGLSQTNGDPLPTPDTNSRLHSLFSPQSPIGNGISDLPRVSGKSVIDQDLDEETGELLKDPVGYAQNGHAGSVSMPRRSTNPQIPTNRFANLSLTTSNMTSPIQSYGPGSARMGVQTPSSTLAPNNVPGNHGFHYPNQHTPRHSLPAANPNDLNPPCNTLYVGNLPADTSEEELKSLFSKQRGYKRLCFRNKQNGPMCFVEFDEIAMASKALNELYGYKLSNSVKTGIRLSFSKNPLGVRNGQPGSMNSSTPLTPPGGNHSANGLAGVPNPMFSTATGPPPGLSAPPGLGVPVGVRNVPIPPGNPHSLVPNASFGPNTGLGIRTNGMNPMSASTLAGGITGASAGHPLGSFNNLYPDYMMGR